MKLRAFVRRFPSQCETFLSRLMRVQIEIKNNVRSVHKEIGSENPPYSRANSPDNAADPSLKSRSSV
jgi:hypothetical protein